MTPRPLRWLAANLGTILIALLLAVIVWVIAVISADPNVQDSFRPTPIDVIGQDPELLLVRDIPATARVQLEAPTSIWTQLNGNPSLVTTWVDLSGYGPGQHTVPVKTRVELDPVRYLGVDPAQVTVVLEPLLVNEVPVELIVNGEPPLGYRAQTPTVKPESITISGPESAVKRVATVSAQMDISGASQSITRTLPVQVLDANGAPVAGLTVSPRTVSVTQPIILLGGYKNLAVKVVTSGQVASGYRLTNLSVTPPNVTVFSDDLSLINSLPGFVETLPVDLSDLTDDIEVNASLALPEGLTLVSEPGVLVQVGVAAIEGSLTLTLPVEILGLNPAYSAEISPPSVDVIIQGPLPILETLTPASFRVVVDLTGLPLGIHQVTPVVDLIPEQVTVQAILPRSVEAAIFLASSRTPTPGAAATPNSPTPAIQATP
jgi:YbbR domain-containing protein